MINKYIPLDQEPSVEWIQAIVSLYKNGIIKVHSKFRIEISPPNPIDYPPFNQQITNNIINNVTIAVYDASVVAN